MSDGRSIVFSGDLGSGKTTIASLVAEQLGLRRISMGEIYRQIAQAHGMTAFELGVHAERDESIDDQIDQLQANMAKSRENLVVDSRLAWFFFQDAFKVHLIVDPTVAAQRVMARPATEVETYSSTDEAVKMLQGRSDGERTRFIQRYGVDKALMRNYHIVCDTTRASREDIVYLIIEAFQGRKYSDITENLPPLLLMDPKRIYPSQDIRGLRDLEKSELARNVTETGRDAIDPISVAYTGRYFYVIDGHRRLSAALQNNLTLIPALLLAELDEKVSLNLSARQFFETEITPSMIYDWEDGHNINLPLPPHLQTSFGHNT